MGALTDSPFAKYVRAIKQSPPGIYNRHLILTVVMYALGGMPKGKQDATLSMSTLTDTTTRMGRRNNSISHSTEELPERVWHHPERQPWPDLQHRIVRQPHRRHRSASLVLPQRQAGTYLVIPSIYDNLRSRKSHRDLCLR
jgi:hypothetical protein